MRDISTDRIIAVGLVVACIIYAVGSVLLGTPISEALLGTVFGGLIGVLRNSDQRKDAAGEKSKGGNDVNQTGNGSSERDEARHGQP